jgi:hypothetical protein
MEWRYGRFDVPLRWVTETSSFSFARAVRREFLFAHGRSMNVGEVTHVMLYPCYTIASHRTFLIERRNS